MDCLFNGEYPVDIKSINCFSFKWLRSPDDVKEKYYHYYLQLQVYLQLFDKEKGFLLFKDKNSGALKIFWYDKDQEAFDKVLANLAFIHRACIDKKFVKRPYTASSKECKRCFMRIHCWKKPYEKRRWG
jgi:hypothetical protein